MTLRAARRLLAALAAAAMFALLTGCASRAVLVKPHATPAPPAGRARRARGRDRAARRDVRTAPIRAGRLAAEPRRDRGARDDSRARAGRGFRRPAAPARGRPRRNAHAAAAAGAAARVGGGDEARRDPPAANTAQPDTPAVAVA